MLSEIRPLMTQQVKHATRIARDIHGGLLPSRDSTTHNARVTYLDGVRTGPTSGENQSDAKAVVWLANHPRPIKIGDIFELPGIDPLSVIRAELRTIGNETLHKVHLS